MFTKDFVVEQAYTTSGTGKSSDVKDNDVRDLAISLNVSAASGTSPTLDVVVEDSMDGINWFTLGTFAQKVAAGKETLRLNTFHRHVRVSYTIGGTSPSFTFGVTSTFR